MLEVSSEDGVLFGCGRSGDCGLVVAFSFDRGFDFIDLYEFPDRSDAIMRKTKSDDILLIGGGESLRVVYFQDHMFHTLRTFRDIFPQGQIITMIQIYRHFVYIISDSGDVIKEMVYERNIDDFSLW